MKIYRAEISGHGYVYVEAEDEVEADLKANAVHSSEVHWLQTETGDEFPIDVSDHLAKWHRDVC